METMTNEELFEIFCGSIDTRESVPEELEEPGREEEAK